MSSVPAPSGGLQSNSNYRLWSQKTPITDPLSPMIVCGPITDLVVTIEVNKDISAPHGLSFQMNCNSPSTANCVWQQYVFTLNPDPGGGAPPRLEWMIDNWPSDAYRAALGQPSGSDLINHSKPLANLAAAALPAGYKLTIALTNDGQGVVTGVTFTVVDNHGVQSHSGLITLTSLYENHIEPPKHIEPSGLAPAYVIEMLMVGQTNGEYGYIEGGGGKFSYAASSALTVTNGHPPGATKTGTAEASNSVYGDLDAGPANAFSQTFATQIPPALLQPGGPLAASRRYGKTETNLYAISARTGQLVQFSVDKDGDWSVQGIGPLCAALPGSHVGVSPQAGDANRTNVFFIDQGEHLRLF